MSEAASIPRRINNLKRLTREYFAMDTGVLIVKHEESLRVFDVRGSVHNKKHPHKMCRVYITRRALKHFVEERKIALLKNHSPEEALGYIDFAVNNLQDCITNFSSYEYEPPNYFYVKDYSGVGKPNLRVLVEETKKGTLEIVSIHFLKSRKK